MIANIVKIAIFEAERSFPRRSGKDELKQKRK